MLAVDESLSTAGKKNVASIAALILDKVLLIPSENF